MELSIRTGTDVGRAIGELRRASGLTQTELAGLVGLDAKYISKIESGRTVTLLEHELRILRRLGASITIEMPDPSVPDPSVADPRAADPRVPHSNVARPVVPDGD